MSRREQPARRPVVCCCAACIALDPTRAARLEKKKRALREQIEYRVQLTPREQREGVI